MRKIDLGNYILSGLFPDGLILVLCLVIHLIGEKTANRKLGTALTFLTAILMSGYIYTEISTGSSYISVFMLTGVMCAATFILGFIPFKPSDYATMFAAFLLIQVTTFIFPAYVAVRYFLILMVLLFLVRCRCKSLKGHIFHVWLNYVIVLILYRGVEYCFDIGVRQIGYQFTSSLVKVAVWGLAALMITGLSGLVIWGVKYLCYDYFKEINEMGGKYHTIEAYFIIITAGIILVEIFAEEMIYYLYGYQETVFSVLHIAFFFSLGLQLLLLTVMFRLSYLRENLSARELENMSLRLYSSDLEENFTAIKNIKHDIKNLFFTMGQYVERSEDRELKAFYHEKIFPFAEGEIRRNDLYARLMMIDNEQLRAFLYYKLMQALALEVMPTVEVPAQIPLLVTGMAFSDIVRILGILLDNALEENLLLEKDERELLVRMESGREGIAVKIQNGVRPQTLREGIRAGVSTKGADRGQGLKIVGEVIAKYDFVALNSYFKDGRFVQNLMIYQG